MTNTAGSLTTTVKGINGTLLSSLATGILKSTTTTGVPSIAVSGTDYALPNANTTGTAANVTGTSNSTLTTLSALSLPSTQITGLGTGATATIANYETTSAAALLAPIASPTFTGLVTAPFLTAGSFYLTGNFTEIASALNFKYSASVVTTGAGYFDAISNVGGTPGVVIIRGGDSGLIYTSYLTFSSTGGLFGVGITAPNITFSGCSTAGVATTTSGGVIGCSNAPTIAVTNMTGTGAFATTGNAGNVTGTSNSTLTTLSALALPQSQVTGLAASLALLAPLASPAITGTASAVNLNVSGKVGINMTGPTSPLEVQATGNSSIPFYIQDSTASFPLLQFRQDSSGVGQFQMQNGTGTTVQVGTGSGGTTFFDSGADFLINTTTDCGKALCVTGNAAITGAVTTGLATFKAAAVSTNAWAAVDSASSNVLAQLHEDSAHNGEFSLANSTPTTVLQFDANVTGATFINLPTTFGGITLCPVSICNLGAEITNSIAGTGTATFAAGAGAGGTPGSPTCTTSHICDSTGGTVSLTNGTTPPTTGVLLTFTTGVTRNNQPECTSQVRLAVSPFTLIDSACSTTTTTAVVNLTGTAPTASVAYTIQVQIAHGN
jgi:hypothetical protein